MLGLSLGLSIGQGNGGGGSAPSALVIDPPVTTALASKTLMAFSPYRVIEGASVTGFRVKRLSDNATSDFGFTADNSPDMAAILAWAAGADVDLVGFLDQKGSGKLLAAIGTVAVIRSGVAKRLATSWSDTTAQLTRLTDAGGIGVDLGDDVGALQLQSTGLLASAGLEFFLLCSSNERKRPTNATDPLAVANNITEYIFSYGDNSNIRMYHQCTGGNHLDFVRVLTSGTDTDAGSTGGTIFRKALAQEIFGYKITPSQLTFYNNGREQVVVPVVTANNSANITAGSLDNRDIVIGNTFASSTPHALRTSLRANNLFCALIVMDGTVTDEERFMINAKLNAIGQSHRIMATDDLMDLFGEVIVMKDVNPATGLVAGRKGQVSLQFETAVNEQGTPNFNFSTQKLGVPGIYAPDDLNLANAYEATNNYFALETTCSVMALGVMDATGNGASYANSVYSLFRVSDGSRFSNANEKMNVGLGWDHNAPVFRTGVSLTRDPAELIGTRKKADKTNFGPSPYDGTNQDQGKYNDKTSPTKFTDGETISSYVFTRSTWENTDVGAPYQLDAPVYLPTPENVGFSYKSGVPIMMIGTVDAGDYSRSATLAEWEAERLDAETWLYLSVGNQPIGHKDSGIAHKTKSPIPHMESTAKIKSNHQQFAYKGLYGMFGFSPSGTVWTMEEAEQIQVNAYKLLAA